MIRGNFHLDGWPVICSFSNNPHDDCEARYLYGSDKRAFYPLLFNVWFVWEHARLKLRRLRLFILIKEQYARTRAFLRFEVY